MFRTTKTQRRKESQGDICDLLESDQRSGNVILSDSQETRHKLKSCMHIPLRLCVLAVFSIYSVANGQTPRTAKLLIMEDALLVLAEEVEVSASASGVLHELLVREGSLVEGGDSLLRVDNRRAKVSVAQARVELEIAEEEARSDVKQRHAQKASDLARSEYDRALAIDAASPASVSDRELERLRLAAEVAELEVERAAHERQVAKLKQQLQQEALQLAQHDEQVHHVTAPIDGLVVELEKRLGEWVERGDTVARIVRVDRIRAEGFLPVAQASLDLTGSPAAFRVMLAGKPVTAKGQVVFVDPKADPVSSLARVWVEFDVTDRRLRPGLRGEVRIEPAGKGKNRQSKQASFAVQAGGIDTDAP